MIDIKISGNKYYNIVVLVAFNRDGSAKILFY